MEQAKRGYIAGVPVLFALALGFFFLPGMGQTTGPALAVAALPPTGPTPTATPACGVGWNLVTSPNATAGNNSLSRVVAISPTDAWAVGYYTTTDELILPLTEHWDGTAWNPVQSPGAGRLFGVAAVSFSDVWAVGYIGDFPGPYTTVIEHWNGTAWSLIPAPNPGTGAQLLGVSAVSASDVWAVGFFYDNTSQTLTLHWDGTAWTQVPSPNAAINTELSAVSALATNDVWAAGAYVSATRYYTLIEHWDGTAWSVVTSPARLGYLYSVVAISATDAWAVGYSLSSGSFQTFTEHWDGTAWSIVPSPNPGLTYNFLYDVAAVSSNDVWAVGRGNGTLTEHWDGTQWSVVPSPNADSGGSLGGVAAVPSTSQLWAVGDYYSLEDFYRTLIERYYDPCITLTSTATASATITVTRTATPSLTASPRATYTATLNPTYTTTRTTIPSPTVTPSLTATVSPGPSNTATASRTLTLTPTRIRTLPPTNTYTPTVTSTRTLTYTPSSTRTFTPTPGSGTPSATPTCPSSWSIVPNPKANSRSMLEGVVAISPTDMWAVGRHNLDTGGVSTLAMHWDGEQWADVPSPNPNPNVYQDTNFLMGVAGVSSNDVWAVGYAYSPLSNTLTLIEHWDGTEWRVVPSPNPDFYTNYLYSVTAVSANDVWAVGEYDVAIGSVGHRTLVQHWDGAGWRVVSSPNVTSNNNGLKGMSAASSKDIWAVGSYDVEQFGHNQTLIEHWNGIAWSTVPSPNPSGATNSWLSGVTVISPSDVWAVGVYGVYDNRQYSLHSLIEHWNGAAWSIVPSPDTGSTDTELMAVSAVSSEDVWAAGYYCCTYGAATLVEHWDGQQWRFAYTVTPDPNISRLQGISAVTSDEVWAVGFIDRPHTLIEHFGPLCGDPLSTPPPSPSPQFTPTPPPCPITFTDVHPTDYFYEPVRYLFCAGAISGYSDNTFRPYNDTTRGQLSKIVVLAEGFPINTGGGPHFSDVPETNPFYAFVETAYNGGLISGYADGTFRSGNNVTRGQLSKIIVLAEGWTINTSGGPHFSDVPQSSPFYSFVETAYSHNVISGYADGTFRPGNNATRGQISKIVYSAVR